MPRLAHRTPKYRKHRASGQAFVELSGHRHYLGPHGTQASKVEYDRLVAEWLANGRRSLRSDSGESVISVAELIVAYWKFAKQHYRKNGQCTGVTPGIKAALRYVRQWYGREPATEFGPLALKAVRSRMVDDGLSRRYINDHVDRIKRCFKWAVAQELIPPETYQALAVVEGLRRDRTKARETDPVLPVDDTIVEATLPFLPEVVMNMVMLQRFTGMRPAELCIMRPCDIDRSDDVWLYRPESHKTEHHGRERVIPIGHRAQGILLKFLARDPNSYCFRPVDSEGRRRAARHAARKTPLQYGNSPGTNRKARPKRTAGERYTTGSYRRAIHRACDKAFLHPTLGSVIRKSMSDLEKAKLRKWLSEHRWSPNQLRHAAATTIRKRFGLEAAQVVLGHASADVTQRYAQRDLAKAVTVAREVG